MIRRAASALALVPALCLADPAIGNWTLEVGKDPQTWENVATLTADSSAGIADEYARKTVHPQLVFSCTPGSDGSVSVRVNWHRFISSFNTEVGFKADDKELLLVNWGVDKSNKVTLPRAASDGHELIGYVAGSSKLQVEVIPYSESLITVSFDISGIDAALEALTAKCT